MKKSPSLSRRFIRYACLLTLLVYILTGVITAALCYRHIRSRQEAINGMIMDSLTEKINESLVSVERIINAVLKISEVTDMIRSSAESSYYTETVTRMQTEHRIADMILQNRDIDGVILKIHNSVMSATNTTLLNTYKFQNSNALQEIQNKLRSNERNGYLVYQYLQEKTNFDCVIYPVMTEQKEMIGSITVVLSKDYGRELELAEDRIWLSDGTSSPISTAEPDQLITTANLNWTGWSVSYQVSIGSIRKQITTTIQWWILIGSLLITATRLLAGTTIKNLFAPIQDMADRIEQIHLNHISPAKIEYHKKGSLQFRLNAFLSIVIFIAVTTIFFLFQQQAALITENEIGSELQTSAKLMAHRTGSILQNKHQIMRNIVVSDAIQQYMNPQKSRNERQLQQQITGFLSENGEISNIAFYDLTGKLLYSSSYREELLEQTGIKEQLIYLEPSPVSHLFKAVEQRLFNISSVRMGMPVVNISPSRNLTNLWGYIFIDWNVENILNLSPRNSLPDNARIEYADPFRYDLSRQTSSPLTTVIDKPGLKRVQVNHEDLCVVAEPVPETGWTLFLCLPWNTYIWQTSGLLILLILFSTGMIILSTLYSQYTVRNLLSDIDQLLEGFSRIHGTELKAAKFHGYPKTNEISVLADGFNRMIDELDTAISEKMESELAAKDAEIHSREMELNLLQMQIKPHFLYNTLRTIQYMIIMGNPSAAKMVDLLIVLFRTGINAENMMIPIHEELEHVKAYIGIQEICFPNLFETQILVDNSIQTDLMLKLILQPLVENAINHGIREGNEHGSITIQANYTEEEIQFIVSDNGVGIEETRLRELNRRLEGNNSEGSVGIFNVNERIKLRYGDFYGLTLESIQGVGTKAIVRFPRR